MNAVLQYSRVQYRSRAKRDMVYSTPSQEVLASCRVAFADLGESNAIAANKSNATYSSKITAMRMPVTDDI